MTERDQTSETTEARTVSVGVDGGKLRVKVCSGTACTFAGSAAVHDAFVAEVEAEGLTDRVEVSIIGCHGLCAQSPVVVLSDDTFYGKVRPDDVKRVVAEHLVGGVPVEALLYTDPATGAKTRDWHDIEFYRQQTRIALRDVGVINPESLDEYLARGGYDAARMVLIEKDPEWVIDEVTESGIRGRGGAGVLHRHEVAVRARRPGRRQVPHLQRRRGRPRRVHGPPRSWTATRTRCSRA